MRRILAIIVCMLAFEYPCGFLFAQSENDDGIPAKVRNDHWSCKEIAGLCHKYGTAKTIPEGEVLERKDLVAPLVALMEKVLETQERQGGDAVPREDLDRIALLHEALKAELALDQGYLIRREAIERMLAKPEAPPFEYRLGAGGFLRGEGGGNFRLTDSSYAPGHGEGRFLYRAKPYAYWHPTEFLDIHAEGQGYGFSGGSQEYNRLSLYQGFVEARLPEKDWLAFKGGRQEFSYGSAFILGPDSFHDGLTFDSVRLRMKPVEPLVFDFLYGSYATPFSGGVEGNLAGAYATYTVSGGNAVEAYALRDSGSTDHHVGEYLYIWGFRVTGKAGLVAVEFEPVYESGRVFNGVKGSNDRMAAYGGHLDLSCEMERFAIPGKFFLSFAYGSGSRDAANGGGNGREFRNPDNESSLVGDMSVLGDLSGITVTGTDGTHHASGLQIYTLGWGADISKTLNFSASGHYVLANHAEDGFSRRLGLETDFTVTYAMTEAVSFVAGYDRFFTGDFFRGATGKDTDIDYCYFMMQFDISASKLKNGKLKPGGG